MGCKVLLKKEESKAGQDVFREKFYGPAKLRDPEVFCVAINRWNEKQRKFRGETSRVKEKETCQVSLVKTETVTVVFEELLAIHCQLRVFERSGGGGRCFNTAAMETPPSIFECSASRGGFSQG